MCSKCKQCPATHYSAWHCDEEDDEDTLCVRCSTCQPGEYELTECTASADTICPPCEAIEHCEDGATTCTTGDDAVCNDCKEGYYGPKCEYEKSFSACGTITTRERKVDSLGYEGDTNEEFVNFCLELCEEFPDCMAFEVTDGGDWMTESGDNDLYQSPGHLARDKSCHMKSAYSRLTSQYEYDCYSNLIRQGDAFREPGGYDEETEWMLWYQAEVLQWRHGWGKKTWSGLNHPADPPRPPECEKTPHCELGVIVNMDKHGCGGTCINPPGLEITADGWTEVEDKYYDNTLYGVDALFNMWINHVFVGVWNSVRDSPVVYDLHSFNGQDYRVDNLGHAFNSQGDAVGAWDEYLHRVTFFTQ